MKTIICAALLASALGLAAGCNSGEPDNARPDSVEKAAPVFDPVPMSAGTADSDRSSNDTANEGPKGVEAQCAECMLNFDRNRMKEIDGRWYCEICAEKRG